MLLCFSPIFNITAFAGNILPQDSEEKLTVVRQCGVLPGESIQLEARRGGEITKAVTWFSSNPSAISCSASGVITGLKAGKSSDITCKYNNETITMTVYCVEKLSNTPGVYFDSFFVSVYAQPDSGTVAHTYVNFVPLLRTLLLALTLIDQQSVYFGLLNKCRLYGWVGDYAYIRFGKELQYDGFVNGARIMNDAHGMLKISQTNMIVWANGVADPENKLTSNKDYARWTVNDAQVATYNPSNGQVIGLKPGRTTIEAEADGFKKICYVYSLYKWPVEWTGMLIDGDYLYRLSANEFYSDVMLTKGSKFTVYGDTGSSDGYAYGCTEEGRWGFVPISEISTKGTISQYRNLGWIWPVRDVKNNATQTVKARYITSPYGWRDSNPIKHKGIDITNGISSAEYPDDCVNGYEVVSAFAGKVVFVHDNNEYYSSCGNCVAIRSNTVDPITGKYYVAVYMHLKTAPIVGVYSDVLANQKIGYVGDTGNSGGSHLHFEVNNQNLSYGQKIYYNDNPKKEMVFGCNINPMFFYMDYYYLSENDPRKITINPYCSAMEYRKPLWYGDDIKESKKP